MGRSVELPCRCCKGTGRVKLTGVYAETLELLAAQAGEITGSELARLAGCKVSAMCNRLAALEAMGLADSRRYGRKRFYRALKEG